MAQLFVFGSVLNKNFKKQSDIDFIADFNPVSLDEYAENYFVLKQSLEKLFNREVDLLEDRAIKRWGNCSNHPNL